jgi:DNA-binding GntR family transcriptional regulator
MIGKKSFALNRIDISSPIPKYFQIYTEIKRAIEDDRYVEGNMFHSESELQSFFKVSRVTVRKALEELERDGYIERIAGRGTVIKSYKNAFYWSRLTSFTKDLQENEKASYIILRFGEEPAGKKTAHLLNLRNNEHVYRLDRIRLVNDQKVALSISYLSKHIPVKLKARMFDEHTSLFALLAAAGMKIGSCDETIEARIPAPEVRSLLEMDGNSAIFYNERISYDSRGRPFEHNIVYHNSGYYRYYIKNGPAFRERYGNFNDEKDTQGEIV